MAIPKDSPIGLKDQPISNAKQEELGLNDYADVLTEFVRRCDTPITIALQGDWGSGKTSLMTLIKNGLDESMMDGTQRYKTVWFNTWQYAQFEMSDRLALSMMSKITDALATDANADVLATVKRGLWAATRAIAIGGASLIGQADTVKEVVNEAERARSGVVTEDPAVALERVKYGLSEIVATNVKGATEKIVIFVDDLDRLVPQRAVELLEALKIFLDIDRCVFVIACDYGVVAAGLKAKFGIAEGEMKGKSFFDKIIQVPFKMPIRRYNADRYIGHLLNKIGIHFDSEKDIGIYRDLVKYSVGFNPRTMKRLLNTLQLVTMLEDKVHHNDTDSDLGSDDEEEHRRHASRVMFGLLCMMEEHESLYDHITDDVSAERIIELRDGIVEDDNFEELRNRIGAKDADEKHGKKLVDKAAQFITKFVDCLQLDDEGDLSDEEIGHLREMLSLTTIVSAGSTMSEADLEELALDMKSELNNRYWEFVNSRSPKYDIFRKSGSKTYFNLPGVDSMQLCFERRGSEFSFYLYRYTYYESERERKFVHEFLRLLQTNLGWEVEPESEDEAGLMHPFVSVPVSEVDAYGKFKSQIFERLDKLTTPRKRLFELVRDAKEASKRRRR